MTDQEMPTVVALGELISTPPVFIEIIPGSGAELLSAYGSDAEHPFLYVEGHLGVPQKVLYRAYTTCVPTFAQLRQSLRRNGPLQGQDWTEELARVSAVILLGNPAHQTALNARRRLVQEGALRADRELSIAEAMLSVRECSKQAIWWRYRRWLLRKLHNQAKRTGKAGASSSASGVEEDSLCNIEITPDTIRHEFKVVARACEIYPRNYYAWIHRYHCLEALAEDPGQTGIYASVLEDEWRTMREWVERHVSDYTAMQYLCRVYAAVRKRRGRGLDTLPQLSPPMSETDSGALFEHSLSLLIAYPEHESLWLYLRAAVGEGFDESREVKAASYAEESLSAPRSPDTNMSYQNACKLFGWFLLQNGGLRVNEALVRRIIAADAGDAELADTLLHMTRG